jgi:hypothetical protein
MHIHAIALFEERCRQRPPRNKSGLVILSLFDLRQNHAVPMLLGHDGCILKTLTAVCIAIGLVGLGLQCAVKRSRIGSAPRAVVAKNEPHTVANKAACRCCLVKCFGQGTS